jgi:hypothetical protein
MSYIEKIGANAVKDQLFQWYDVTKDPNMDGYTGWGCKQKLYDIKFYLDELIKTSPKYHGEEEWLDDQKMLQVQKILEGKRP